MRVFSAVAAAAMIIGLGGAPAVADTAGQAAEKTRDPDRVVCKTKAKTGSRLATKTCHTVKEWDIIAEENRRTFQEANGPTINTARGN